MTFSFKSFVKVVSFSLLLLVSVFSYSAPSYAAKESTRAVMDEATKKLKNSAIINKARKKGQTYIDFELKDAHGKSIKVSNELKKGPVILTFYRGGWCPYCNEQLNGYQQKLSMFEKLGAQLIAVSPDKPESEQDTISKNEIKFKILSDPLNAIAKKYGLVFKVEKDLRDVYLGFGIDLEKSQGNNKWELPIPATYVIQKNGKISYSFLDVNYKNRASVEDITNALKK